MCIFGGDLFLTKHIPEKNQTIAKKINVLTFNEDIIMEVESSSLNKEETQPGYVYNAKNEEVLFAIGSKLFSYKKQA